MPLLGRRMERLLDVLLRGILRFFQTQDSIVAKVIPSTTPVPRSFIFGTASKPFPVPCFPCHPLPVNPPFLFYPLLVVQALQATCKLSLPEGFCPSASSFFPPVMLVLFHPPHPFQPFQLQHGVFFSFAGSGKFLCRALEGILFHPEPLALIQLLLPGMEVPRSHVARCGSYGAKEPHIQGCERRSHQEIHQSCGREHGGASHQARFRGGEVPLCGHRSIHGAHHGLEALWHDFTCSSVFFAELVFEQVDGCVDDSLRSAEGLQGHFDFGLWIFFFGFLQPGSFLLVSESQERQIPGHGAFHVPRFTCPFHSLVFASLRGVGFLLGVVSTKRHGVVIHPLSHGCLLCEVSPVSKGGVHRHARCVFHVVFFFPRL
mmetsp:Transcript_401/g.3060  ORF Transcript_401/g.3060 Transcript_401/m.3060 type:complete len:374 (+) Transcript_401:265-1386(+)